MNKFGRFYQANKTKLFAYILRRTGQYELSKDIMQESFTRLLEHYGPDAQNTSLLFTIARNALMDQSRRLPRTQPIEKEHKATSVNPEHHLLIREDYRNVLSALQQIEESERDILSLAVSSNLSYREIAKITETSEVNVRVKVHRARTKLRKILQGEQNNEPFNQHVYR